MATRTHPLEWADTSDAFIATMLDVLEDQNRRR